MIRADLQIHTKYSFDSWSSPESVVEESRRKKIDIIGITDHDGIEGALKVKEIARGKPYVIVGQEIHTNKGEIIGLFLKEKIILHNFERVITEIKKQNGLVVLPHPRKRKIFLSNSEIEKSIDLIEVYNSRSFDEQNLESESFADTLTKRGKTSGSDAHFAFEIGTSYMCLKDFRINELSVRKNIMRFNGKIYKKRNLLFVESFSQLVAFLKSHKTKFLINSLNIFCYSLFREFVPGRIQRKIYSWKNRNETSQTKLIKWYDRQASSESANDSYLSRYLGKRYYYQKRFSKIIKLLPQKGMRSVIEIGCGTGYYTAYLSKIAQKVASLDISDEYLVTAKKYVSRFGKIDRTVFININDFNPLKNKNKFDTLLCSEVLEHVAKPYIFLEQYLDCVKLGGFVILSFPSKYSFDEFYMKTYGIFAFNEHISTIDDSVLDKMLKQRGFIKCNTDRVGFGYFYFNKILSTFPFLIQIFDKMENVIARNNNFGKLCWTYIVSYKKIN